FSFEHVDHFVLMGVPVALTGPRARRQRREVDTELREPGGDAEALVGARSARLVEGSGVRGPCDRGDSRDVDSWHGMTSSDAAFFVGQRLLPFQPRDMRLTPPTASWGTSSKGAPRQAAHIRTRRSVSGR